MTEANLFPGITVKRVDTKSSVTEIKGKPSMQPVEEGIKAITPEMLKDRFAGESVLIYTMDVDAVSQYGANVRAKAYVRTKNFFEPTMVNVVNSEKMTSGKYSVAVGVRK